MTCKMRDNGTPCHEIDALGKCEPEKHGCSRQQITINPRSRRITKDDIGKKVTFKIHGCTWIPRKETRIIKDVTPEGYIVVRYSGSDRFLIKPDEVISLGGTP